MKVLVTGASGFIGQRVLDALQRLGVAAVAAGRTRPPAWQGEFIAADLLTDHGPSELVNQARASHLVHLAWFVEHGEFWNSSRNIDWVNASARLVDAFCRAGGRKIVSLGTCAEYDWSCNRYDEESTPVRPDSLYGTSKDAFRRLAQQIASMHGTAFAWGRLFHLFGPGEDTRRVIPALAAVFNGHRSPFGISTGVWRDYLHVDDVASALCRLCTDEHTGIFNIASGFPIRLEDVVRSMAAAARKDPGLVLDISQPGIHQPQFLVGDNSRLLATGWRRTMHLDSYATRLIAKPVP